MDAPIVVNAIALKDYKTTEVFKALDPTVDVGSLLLHDLDPFDTEKLRLERENYLKELARDNTQYLLNQIWKLNTERVQDAIVALLPEPSVRVPREKPIPKKKPETKWQKFARAKGLPAFQRKKSRMTWDEQSQSWKPRWGYQRANDETRDWMIEVPGGADPYRDMFAERINAKKERVAKNELQRMRNIARAAGGKVPGVGAAHIGNPNMEPLGNKSTEQMARQLQVAKQSTASVGKFTERLHGEKPPKDQGKRHQFDPNEGNVANEKKKLLDIWSRIEQKKPKLDVHKAMLRENVAEREQTAPDERKLKKKTKSTSKKSKTGKKGSNLPASKKGAKGSKKRQAARMMNKKSFKAKKAQQGRKGQSR